jgi:hypothetical protein
VMEHVYEHRTSLVCVFAHLEPRTINSRGSGDGGGGGDGDGEGRAGAGRLPLWKLQETLGRLDQDLSDHGGAGVSSRCP